VADWQKARPMSKSRACNIAQFHRSQVLDTLVEQHAITIDRPRGTAHPRYPDLIYPLDYGYLEDTRSGDDGGIDVWIGSIPGRQVSAVILTVDLLKKDGEMKLLLGCNEEEKQILLRMHQRGSQSALLVSRM
jgi:inorganic pyrophosphatase